MLAYAFSSLAMFFSYVSYKRTDGNTDIELYLRIKEAELEILKYNNQIIQKQIKADDSEFIHSIEVMLNLYEILSYQYINNKYNRKAIRKLFGDNIKNIVENDVYKDFFSDETYNFEYLLKCNRQIDKRRKTINSFSEYFK